MNYRALDGIELGYEVYYYQEGTGAGLQNRDDTPYRTLARACAEAARNGPHVR